jgi:hypothetical protein
LNLNPHPFKSKKGAAPKSRGGDLSMYRASLMAIQRLRKTEWGAGWYGAD